MKEALRTVAKYPATWVAIVAVALVVWLLISWFDPPLVVTVLLLLVAVLFVFAWPLTMSATGTLERLQFAPPEVDDRDPQIREELQLDLRLLDCEQGANQVHKLRANLDDLTDVLRHRLDAGELTYSRYLGTAHRVYLAAIENLREVVVALKAVSSIDPEYIARRLGELRGSDESDSSATEIETLESRGDLRKRQVKKVETLLAQNESAMTALSKTASALADAPIGRTPADAEAAMGELDNLAQRAAKYASPT